MTAFEDARAGLILFERVRGCAIFPAHSLERGQHLRASNAQTSGLSKTSKTSARHPSNLRAPREENKQCPTNASAPPSRRPTAIQ